MLLGAKKKWTECKKLRLADSDRANNNSLIAHIQNLPGFDASKARIVVQHYAPKVDDGAETDLESPDQAIGPTAAELILPWRRDRSYQSIGKRYHLQNIPSINKSKQQRHL